MIAFQTDKSIEVKKFVIGFIEEAWWVSTQGFQCCGYNNTFVIENVELLPQSFYFLCLSSKRDNELLLRLIANLNMLLKDESVNVVKKAILTLTQLYKVTLQVNTGFI